MAVEFVNVYCKIQQGLTMCLENNGDVQKVTLPRSSRYIQPHPHFKPTKEEFIVFGSSCTPVAKEFWEAWKKRMGLDYPPLKNELIWAVEPAKKADGIAKAREMETTLTGYEQIDPKKEKGITKLNPDQDTPLE